MALNNKRSFVSSIAAELMSTLSDVMGLSHREIAERAGCEAALIAAIESGRMDPALDTIDRIANSVGLEVRAVLTGAEHDMANLAVVGSERDRVRALLEDAVAFRHDVLGLGPAVMDPELQLLWDGTDPAPPRQWSAGSHRGDDGGHAATLLKLARQRAAVSQQAFAETIGIEVARLGALESGNIQPGIDELVALLRRAQFGLRLRLEIFDPHDDELHREALRRPASFEVVLTSRAREIAAAPMAGAATPTQ